MLSSVEEETSDVKGEVKSVCKTEVVEEAETACNLMVEIVSSSYNERIIVCSENSSVEIWNYTPYPLFVEPPYSVCEVAHDVCMEVCESEFLLVLTLLFVVSCIENVLLIAPHCAKESRVSSSCSPAWVEPFSYVSLYAPAECRTIAAVTEEVYSTRHVYEPVVPKAVCKIWATDDIALCISVFGFLGIGLWCRNN